MGFICDAHAWWIKPVGLKRWIRNAEVGELTQADAGFGERSV
jgi:hypothetical protein